eukprot:CAMPEP_0206596654 /NCGR_PEP_ID=MMETSP0325_2-20121206/43678_1 /ASSEMBLY_ACC=CAM_ASM_000347 /TAXON_ID=2866 /ORGANISM="Crypthecodinium cohnii, Strain Seligo" /LENGTH=826 /DNA_ID=CAMNT_0054107507 /DNA_START=216 /DNA_END=2696 /DNA_ORIENTATION=+
MTAAQRFRSLRMFFTSTAATLILILEMSGEPGGGGWSPLPLFFCDAHRVEGMTMAMGDLFKVNLNLAASPELDHHHQAAAPPPPPRRGQEAPFSSLAETSKVEGVRSLMEILAPMASFVQDSDSAEVTLALKEDHELHDQHDEASNRTGRGDTFPFEPIRFAGIAKAMRKFRSGGTSSLSCGESLLKKWYVKDSELVEDAVKFMSAKDAWRKSQSKKDKKVVGSSKLTSLVSSDKREEAYWMPKDHDDDPYRGLKVVRINNEPIEKLSDVSDAVQKSPERVKLELEVGVDFRGCWGNLHDRGSFKDKKREKRHVCGKAVMENLIDELQYMVPKENKMGHDESVVIDNDLSDFVLKTAKNKKEIDLISNVAKEIRSYVLWAENDHRMWTTSLAPICGIISMPGLAQWVVMRKVAVPAAAYGKTVDNRDVGMWELKGPKYASVKDGKTWVNRVFGSTNVWEGRDYGFAEAFPQGVRMLGCGSYDAQQVFLQDVRFLGAQSMTDYSLLAKMYHQIDNMQEADCCATPGVPLFPIALRTEHFDLAFGIIDWYEQKVRSGISGLLSTMESPATFQAAFSAMWGTYFWPKNVDVDKEDSTKSEVVFKKDGMCDLPIGINKFVSALQDLSWEDHKETLTWDKTKDSAEFEPKVVYTKQFRPKNSRNSTHASLRILAGTTGLLEAGAHHMEPQAVTVKWTIPGTTETFLALTWGSQLADDRLKEPRFSPYEVTNPIPPPDNDDNEDDDDDDNADAPEGYDTGGPTDSDRAAGRADMGGNMKPSNRGTQGSLVVVIIVGIIAAVGLLAFLVTYNLGWIGSNNSNHGPALGTAGVS